MTLETKTLDAGARLVDALYRIVRTVQNVHDLPTLLETIMQESRELTGAEASSLFLYDPERDDLYFEVVIGEKGERIKEIRVPVDHGFVGAAATGRETVIVEDARKDKRHFTKVDSASGFVTRNLIAVPMIRNEQLIGVIEVLNKSCGGVFSAEDAKVLEIMAEQAAVAIENSRLIAANVQAERLAALGTATGSLAHYIKNIIQRLSGSESLINMGLERRDDKMLSEAWPIMRRALTDIKSLVQDMLKISKEREPEREPVELNTMIREIMDCCRAGAEQAGIELIMDLDDNLPITMLDPRQFHDSLLNLAGNAIEALESALKQEDLENPQLRASTRFDAEAKRIAVEVEDNGPGMPPEVQKRVLEPFFSTKGSRGTGLGLAVVNKTVQEHGGRLRLESEVGRGTKFTIELPHQAPV